MKYYKIIILSLFLSVGLNLFSQTTEEEYHQLIFGDIFENHAQTNFLIDLTDRLSKIEVADGTADSPTLHFEDWLKIYHELKSSAISPVSYPSLADLYSNALAPRLSKNNERFSFPVGILYHDYDVLLGNALDDNLVYIDENGLTIRVNNGADPVEQNKLFAGSIMIDTMYNVDIFDIFLDTNFIFSNAGISSINVIHNGDSLGNLRIGNSLTINPDLGYNEISIELVIENQPNIISKSFFINKDLIGLAAKSGSPFNPSNVIATSLETFEANGISAGIKIFYGCNNSEKILRKPVIISSGFNPLNIEQFFMLINKFNSNGLLDELHFKDYDIVVVRYNVGAGRMEPNADVLVEIIKEMNRRKWENGSYHENLTIGYSAGALSLKAALKKMEVEYQNNPVEENWHHCKLYVSYDSEHQGANIPLSAQHSLNSLTLNPPLAVELGLLILILNQTQLINSGTARDFLMYHYTQTGTPSSPSQAPHPFFNEFFGKFNNDFFYQKPPFDRPGDYAQIRNIAISQGSANGQLHSLNNAPNDITLEIDRERGDPDKWYSWSRKQYLQWKTVDGTQQSVFTRRFEKKPIFFSTFEVVIDEEFRVNNNSALLDAAPGSTAGFHDVIRNLTKGFMVLQIIFGDINVDFPSTDCFVPTVSALDIKNHNNNLIYNLRANDLLWEDPDAQFDEEQENEVGYPSIIHGSNQYNFTPFDAVFAYNENDKHGAKEETNLITDFILSEVHSENIWLQFLTVGAFANGSYHHYPAQFEAQNIIECGEAVTFKTQNKPFICTPESEVKLKAGKSIHFKPGTHLQAGSKVHAYIESPVVCPKSMLFNNQNEEDDTTEETPTKSNVSSNSNVLYNKEVKLYPNPNEGIFNIENPFEEELEVLIVDNMGREVHSGKAIEGTNTIQVQLSQGIYMVKVENDLMHKNFKILVK